MATHRTEGRRLIEIEGGPLSPSSVTHTAIESGLGVGRFGRSAVKKHPLLWSIVAVAGATGGLIPAVNGIVEGGSTSKANIAANQEGGEGLDLPTCVGGFGWKCSEGGQGTGGTESVDESAGTKGQATVEDRPQNIPGESAPADQGFAENYTVLESDGPLAIVRGCYGDEHATSIAVAQPYWDTIVANPNNAELGFKKDMLSPGLIAINQVVDC